MSYVYANKEHTVVTYTNDLGEVFSLSVTAIPPEILATIPPYVESTSEMNENILHQINLLEDTTKIPRVIREFTLAQAVITAAAAGVDEPTLYAQNIGYKKLKDLDDQIFALRQQLQ